jgi:hypothetical protein
MPAASNEKRLDARMPRCAPCAVALYARHDQAELSPEEQMGASQTDQKTQPRGPFIG